MTLIQQMIDQTNDINPEPRYPFQIIQKQRLGYQITQLLIREALDALGQSVRGLARLLGTDKNHLGKWRSGKQRLSAAYSGRLIYLLTLSSRGLPLQMAYSYRWENDEIRWLSRKYSSGSLDDHLAARAWEFEIEKPYEAPTELTNWRAKGPGP